MNDELRELRSNPCKNCYACDFSKDDKCYSGSYKQCSVCAVIQNTIDKCKAHTDKAVKAARVDEVERWHSYWNNGKDTRNTETYKSDRIKELQEGKE